MHQSQWWDMYGFYTPKSKRFAKDDMELFEFVDIKYNDEFFSTSDRHANNDDENV